MFKKIAHYFIILFVHCSFQMYLHFLFKQTKKNNQTNTLTVQHILFNACMIFIVNQLCWDKNKKTKANLRFALLDVVTCSKCNTVYSCKSSDTMWAKVCADQTSTPI